ncbi:hypothetical protein S7335_4020 [Synechococcus sp. PCC 7335]|uniref:hypothetical protein n=1 Tax=Synechococcus sp. (strain ATCC 29403 / PCC 7335) TaxID=91464 RepID=UPI00017EE384|nr:hypothetical protein [Synechococcus sp. PCC 7335]EDX86317.1 hypothetical protein S7335_4020 [Synechococcus sp. PCC 7335]
MTCSKLPRLLKLGLITGLIAIVLFTFHALSVLVFAALGQVPGTANWSKGLILVGVLAIASATVCLQSLITRQPIYQWLGTTSSAASGAVLGVFVAGRISGQQIFWVMVGLVVGCLLFGVIAFWSYGGRMSESRRLIGGAIALINGLCAYALAFGIGTWLFAAIAANSWLLASILGIATLSLLFATRRSLSVFKRCL